MKLNVKKVLKNQSQQIELFDILSDPGSKKGCTQLFHYKDIHEAQYLVYPLMDNLYDGLKRMGYAPRSMRDSVALIGPTAGIQCPRLTSAYPEVEKTMEMQPNAQKIYLIEPNISWFPQLIEYARSLPPQEQRRLVLVNEKMDNLGWGHGQGIPSSSVGLSIANSVFDIGLYPAIDFQKSISELSRITRPEGLIATRLFGSDRAFGNFEEKDALLSNRIELLPPVKGCTWSFAKKSE